MFCVACHEELSLKRSIIRNHIQSQKHVAGKASLKQKVGREQDIANALEKHNNKEHLQGETLPMQQQVYRVKVVTALLKAGIPLSKLNCLRDILEENAFRLTDRRHMFDLVPFVQKEEARLKNEIDAKYISLIFNGTSRLGGAMAVVVRFVSSDWILEQRYADAVQDNDRRRSCKSVLSVQYGVQSEFLLGTMRDRASVNNVAMQTVYPSVVDIGCFSHTLNHVGENFKTPFLTEFIHSWITLFSHSPRTKLLWRTCRPEYAILQYNKVVE